jgi:hypothetical protein
VITQKGRKIRPVVSLAPRVPQRLRPAPLGLGVRGRRGVDNHANGVAVFANLQAKQGSNTLCRVFLQPFFASGHGTADTPPPDKHRTQTDAAIDTFCENAEPA